MKRSITMKLASPRFTRCKCFYANTVDRNTHPESAFVLYTNTLSSTRTLVEANS